MSRPARTRHAATVAAGFVTGMLAGLRARGLYADPLLEEIGANPGLLAQSGARVPLDDYATLYNAVVRATGDEGFAIFSQPLRSGTFEFLCRCVVSSATLAEALDRASRFLRLVLPDLRVTITRRGPWAHIDVEEMRALAEKKDDPARVFAYEWLLRLLHGLSCWLVGRGLVLDRVEFPYPPPPHAADYGLVYTEHSVFHRPRLVATFDAELLELPVRRDESDLAAFLEGAPGKIAVLYRRDREMVRSVRALLAKSIADSPTLEDAARHLNLSPRTLHRRLHEEGSSFREIKDKVRREIAMARLEKTRQSVAEIAAELGYSEPSAFFRAFQGWTGEAPSTHRKRMKKGN